MNEKIYNDNPKKCICCNLVLPYIKRNNTYCSLSCSAKYSQRNGGNRKYTDSDRKKVSEWAKKHAYKHERKGSTKPCPNCHIDFYQHPSENRICCSMTCYLEWNKKTGYMRGKTGGYRKEAGRGKMGWYKGYYCNSSWELAWVIYQLDHNIIFKRNLKGFDYEFKNRIFKFYPDFIINDDNYVEIKGWVTEKDEEKIKQFKFPLKVLYRKEMNEIIKYVVNKHGKNYTGLYEKIN